MSETQTTPRPRSPSRAKRHSDKTKKVDIALQLQEAYEFKIEDGKAVLLDDDKPLAQSWTGLSVSGPQLSTRYHVGTRDAYVDIPYGVTAVLGKAGAGKTRFAFEHLFARAVSDKRPARFYRLFEPGSDEFFIRIPGSSELVRKPTFEIEFAKELAQDLTSPEQDLLIVDSFRYLFYSSSGGATGPGGVNMSLFMQLTHLDILAAQLAKRLVILINPLTNNDEAYANYVEACKGAVTTVISVRSFDTIEMSSRLAATRGARVIRIGAETVLGQPNYGTPSSTLDVIAMDGGDDVTPIARLVHRPKNGA